MSGKSERVSMFWAKAGKLGKISERAKAGTGKSKIRIIHFNFRQN